MILLTSLLSSHLDVVATLDPTTATSDLPLRALLRVADEPTEPHDIPQVWYYSQSCHCCLLWACTVCVRSSFLMQTAGRRHSYQINALTVLLKTRHDS